MSTVTECSRAIAHVESTHTVTQHIHGTAMQVESKNWRFAEIHQN